MRMWLRRFFRRSNRVHFSARVKLEQLRSCGLRQAYDARFDLLRSMPKVRRD